MIRIVRFLAPAILTTLVSASAPRIASADEAAARQFFRKGVELYDRKQYEPALEQFRSAYAEKPSAGIKQNIGLCLEGLGRPIEAATAFDEALDEGEGTLKPDVRASMEQELAALSKQVATVRLKVISAADLKPLDTVVVTVDGKPLTSAQLRRPVRLEPGIHVFTAHSEGLADPPEKKLSILAGSPVDATFELGVPQGLLTVRPNVAEATVQIDGVEVGHGAWSGKLSAGSHRVTVTAPGFQTTSADVVVSSGASVEYPMTLERPGEGPPAYEMPARKPPRPLKPNYVVPTVSFDAQSLTLSKALQERDAGTKRPFAGASVGVRAGHRVSRGVAFELLGNVGQTGTTYSLSSASLDSSTKVTHWEIVPAIRFSTNGAVRFTVATGFGLHGSLVSADLHTRDDMGKEVPTSAKGSGLSATWLVDVGLQIDLGSTLFLEIAGNFDTYGVGTTRDDDSNARYFLESPSTRGGLRVGLGFQF